MPKHVFFDLDETLTPSRSRMLPEHAALFAALCQAADVIVVSGAQESQMRKQLPEDTAPAYIMLTQNGNHAIDKDGAVLWSESFTSGQTALIDAFIKKVHDDLSLAVRDENDLVEHRGSQISYSLIGHNAPLEEKKAFDPGAVRRKHIMASYNGDTEALKDAGVEVVAGGTTCLDIYLLGRNKGFNIRRLNELKGWHKEDCLYFGDALEPGRNDESVLGVIPTQAVTGPEETFMMIEKMLQ